MTTTASPSLRYQVEEALMWLHTTGRTASITGAVPYASSAEREGWSIASRGWTIRDNRTNTTGMGRVPWKTKAEADAQAAQWNDEDQVRRGLSLLAFTAKLAGEVC